MLAPKGTAGPPAATCVGGATARASARAPTHQPTSHRFGLSPQGNICWPRRAQLDHRPRRASPARRPVPVREHRHVSPHHTGLILGPTRKHVPHRVPRRAPRWEGLVPMARLGVRPQRGHDPLRTLSGIRWPAAAVGGGRAAVSTPRRRINAHHSPPWNGGPGGSSRSDCRPYDWDMIALTPGSSPDGPPTHRDAGGVAGTVGGVGGR